MGSSQKKKTNFPAAPERTLISKDVFPVDPKSPFNLACTKWAGRKWCGRELKVTMEVPGCGTRSVKAIGTRLPKGNSFKAVLGRDVLDSFERPWCWREP